MHVVIVESPAKCKTLCKYLGKDYKVLASFGHIRDLPSKDGSVRPEEDFAMDYQISRDSSKHVKAIADAVKGADSLILATDPDREGEAISWHVLEALKKRKALKKDVVIQRVAFSSITKKAVQDAVANPRDIDMDLVNAQQARRALDYLVGFNLSPVLWRKLPGSKSAGRVQSVALRIICDRESDIEKFIAREYWSIKADFNTEQEKKFTASLTHINGEKLDKFSLENENSAKTAKELLEGKEYTVKTVEKKQSRRNPYAPFTTSTLQQEASRKLGFSASQTMQTAQKLYEGINLGDETAGLITYMRTDGVTVAPEAIFAARDHIEKEYGAEYLPKSPRMYKTKAKNAQEGHEAIRPTDPTRTPSSVASYLNKDQLRLYDLVWKRMIASQMESVVLDMVAADIESDDKKAILRATGSTIRFDGFYRLYNEGKDDESEDGENVLPTMNEGEKSDLLSIDDEQHFTQPPPRFSEASLVKKLEELGIGRPSTYASIISVLQSRDYVRLEKKRFFPEMRGRFVTTFLTNFFSRYVEYDFTAHLEDELDEISDGKLEWKKALKNFWGDFSANVDSAMELQFTDVIEKLNEVLLPAILTGEGDIEKRTACPKCDEGKLGLKMGKFGAFLGCSNYPECKHTVQISQGGTTEEVAEGNEFETKTLGLDEKTGLEITIKKGPYGFYVQLGEPEGKKKPKRASLDKGANPDDITLEKAISMLSLPREVGNHPETEKLIEAGVGRFGPYLKHNGKFVSLKGDDNVYTIGLERAVEVIAKAGTKKGAEPLKILGKHPKTEKEIAVYDGRYGPYVKHEKTNASLPKGKTPDNVTLEEAIELLATRKKKAKKK